MLAVEVLLLGVCCRKIFCWLFCRLRFFVSVSLVTCSLDTAVCCMAGLLPCVRACVDTDGPSALDTSLVFRWVCYLSCAPCTVRCAPHRGR